jgi:hypothetical protein
MRSIVRGHVAVMAGLVMMLAGCAATGGDSHLSAAHSPQLAELSAARSPQLAESYPCQSMHVKAMSCPPG